jgi:hypothetical protein
MLDGDAGADTDLAAPSVLFDHDRSLQAVAEDRDPPLEEPLLVLRRVVLEVLGEIAEAARGLDRLDDLGALRPLELGQLGLELCLLVLRQMFCLLPDGLRLATRGQARGMT